MAKLHRKIEGQGYTRPGVKLDAVTAAIEASLDADTAIGAIDRQPPGYRVPTCTNMPR